MKFRSSQIPCFERRVPSVEEQPYFEQAEVQKIKNFPFPSAATTSMSGSKQPGAWPGLTAALPCPTPLSLGNWPPPWTTCPWGSEAPPGAREMSIVQFQIKISGSCGSESPWSHGVSGPFAAIWYFTCNFGNIPPTPSPTWTMSKVNQSFSASPLCLRGRGGRGVILLSICKPGCL